MGVSSLVSKLGPAKEVLYQVYKRRKEKEYLNAFRTRLKEIKDVNAKIQNKLNVIIVVADCLRFKNTTLGGHQRDTTPFLASLKNTGKAVSSAPWTHPSVASIMTGMYPHNHGAYIHSKIRNFDNPKDIKGIRRGILTLPEIAAINNYNVYIATSIEVASFPLKGRAPINLYPAETPGEKIISDFFRWLDKKGGNFFAYIHLGDTHEPLNPPREFKNYFGQVKRIKGIERWAYQRIEEQRGREFEEFRENKILLYDNTIRYVDGLFERVYHELEKRKHLEDTIVVFTADHGEEFWEHAKLEAENFYDPRGIYGVGHGHNLFNEIIEVPLAVDGSIQKLKINNRPLVDIFPTIIDAWETEVPYRLDGRPLNGKPRYFNLSEATGYGYEKKAFIVRNNLKLLYAPDDNVEWLFVLDSDREELKPVRSDELTKNLREKLLSILARDELKNRTFGA